MAESSQPPAYSGTKGARHFDIDLMLPKNGIVIAETSKLQPVLCKPKILPLKSAVLEKAESDEAAMQMQEADARAAGATATIPE